MARAIAAPGTLGERHGCPSGLTQGTPHQRAFRPHQATLWRPWRGLCRWLVGDHRHHAPLGCHRPHQHGNRHVVGRAGPCAVHDPLQALGIHAVPLCRVELAGHDPEIAGVMVPAPG